MKAKDKAKELVFRFGKIDHINNRCLPFKQAKQCALIAVDEMINDLDAYIDSHYHDERMSYWENVRSEIEKL